MENLKVVIVEPGKPGRVEEIPHELSEMQKIVGGYIEAITLQPVMYFDKRDLDNRCILVCNEEGKLLGLPLNQKIGDDIICGTFFICAAGAEEFKSLSDELAEYWVDMFKDPREGLADEC